MRKPVLFIFLLLGFSGIHAQDIRLQLARLDTAFYDGHYEVAEQLVTEIYPSFKKSITDDTLLVEFLNTAGSLYYHMGAYERAIPFFQEAAAEASTRLGEQEYHYALALFNQAGCYKELGRYAEAEPLYLKSLPLLAPAMGQNSLQYTRCFYTLASLYIDMNKFAEAESMCAAAVNFYKAVEGDTSADYLGALGSMGVIYQGLAQYEKAEEIYLSLKKYHSSREQPDVITLQVLENNLGDLYRHWGDYEKAIVYLQRAVQMAGDSSIQAASALNNLGLVQKATGDYPAAERSYKKSIAIYIRLQKANHPDYTNPVNNLGELYRTMGRYQDAVYAFEEVLELRRTLLGTNHPNYANALNNLALVETAVGSYGPAEQHLLECRDTYKRLLGDKDKYYANSLNNLASLYNNTGQYKKAEENYLACLAIYKTTYGVTSDKYGLYLGGLAATYRLMKRYDEAIALTLQSMDILRNKLGEQHYDYIETRYHLAETYREAKKFKEAEEHYLKATEGYLMLIQRYFPYLSEQEKTDFYFNVAAAFETFNSFVLQVIQEFPAVNHDALVARMYNNQVALKSLLLKESEATRVLVAASTDEQLKKNYADWLNKRETIVQYYRMNAEEIAATGTNLPTLEAQANELEQRIAVALKKNSSPNSSAQPVSWSTIRDALHPGEVAIEIIRTDYFYQSRWTDTVFYSALIIKPGSKTPQLVPLANGKQLETRHITNYRRLMRLKLFDDISYDAFWLPLRNDVEGATKIFMSADGVYQQVNLNTLRNPSTKKFLLEEINLELVTNTKDLLRSPVAARTNSAVIVAFPDFGNASGSEPAKTRMSGFPDLKALPGTGIEADSVSNLLRTAQWKVNEYLQREATEETVKNVKSPGVLHIATHGFFLPDIRENAARVLGLQAEAARMNPLLRSGVILAQAAAIAIDSNRLIKAGNDGILTAYEAVGLDLAQTDLVVLSACETGLGELLNSQGIYGLQRSFLVAGAKAAMISLWVIDDRATVDLWTNFYRSWLNDPGAGKQQALRKAALTLMKTYPHPYYWGAFVMVGD